MRSAAKRMLRPLLLELCRHRPTRAAIELAHRHLHGKGQWNRVHPHDRANGISTQGFYPWWLLQTGSASDRENSGYAGCQPSCIRRGLSTVPDPELFSYLDLGCGKGRSLAVASEFPFRRIVGVEIAPKLAAVATDNAAIMGVRHPDRTPIEVIAGDATLAELPAGDLVVFLYHSFSAALLQSFLSRLMAAKDGDEVFFVYENPANGALLDATPGFTRWHAETVPCDAEEVGFAPDDSETIVVWRFGGNPAVPPFAGAGVRITGSEWRATLATDVPD